jgi:copper chaperone CopZ
MKEKLTAIGAVLAAVVASSCCWGPLLLAGLGAGSVGFAAGLAPYRPYFIAVTLVFLAGAWYLVLRKRSVPASASACCAAQTNHRSAGNAERRNKILLGSVTAFALAMLAFPKIQSVLATSRSQPTPSAVNAGPTQGVLVSIKGMTCEACQGHVEEALLKVPGVVSARASYQHQSAEIAVRPGSLSEVAIRRAISRVGYQVRSITPVSVVPEGSS